jgi:PiT family inorganic phosphate transporter
MLATVTGFPVSTTHGLTGALLGAGLAAVGMKVNFSQVRSSFVVPLLLSPVVAVVLGTVVYLFARAFRVKCGVTKEWCVCIGETEQIIPIPQPASVLYAGQIALPDISIGTIEQCVQRYRGRMLGVSTQKLLDFFHFISAGSACFARGLNDTPKIVALLLVIKAVGIRWGMIVVAVGMAVGGLMNARKVAITMSKKITPLNHGQGFTANLVTAVLVIFASRWGLPVSTTHVSVGSLFGIGLITRQANLRVVSGILMSWILTLPVAAILGGIAYRLLVS